MIDLVVLGTYIVTGIAPLAIVKTYEKRKRISKYFKVLFSSNPVFVQDEDYDEQNYPDAGLSYVEYNIEEDDIQYLFRLRHIHKDALEDYNTYHKKKPIDSVYERVVLMNMLHADQNESYVNIGQHTMIFGDNLEVWIENRYFAFGTCHRYTEHHRKLGIIGSREATVSEYTFLRMVDFFEKRAQFNLWKEKNDEYTISILSKRENV